MVEIMQVLNLFCPVVDGGMVLTVMAWRPQAVFGHRYWVCLNCFKSAVAWSSKVEGDEQRDWLHSKSTLELMHT